VTAELLEPPAPPADTCSMAERSCRATTPSLAASRPGRYPCTGAAVAKTSCSESSAVLIYVDCSWSAVVGATAQHIIASARISQRKAAAPAFGDTAAANCGLRPAMPGVHAQAVTGGVDSWPCQANNSGDQWSHHTNTDLLARRAKRCALLSLERTRFVTPAHVSQLAKPSTPETQAKHLGNTSQAPREHKKHIRREGLVQHSR
jgi:hypothetical protein